MLRFRSDAGHGWLEVPRMEVRRLDIVVTPFSYQKDDKVYLEEDLDAVTYLNARAAEIGVELKDINEHITIEEVYDGDISPIRNYTNYSQNYKEIEHELRFNKSVRF